MNEPESFLMRLCEAIQYSDLLDKASMCDDSLSRLMYITVFASTCYAVAERTGKPFNPLLGETYEYLDDSRNGFRFISEQVSHHPPIGACHAENTNWKFWQSQCLRTKFTGNSLDCSVVGTCQAIIKRTNEFFKWECVRTCVHNVIVGKLWLDHYGEVDIVNKTTGERARLKMKPCGWFSRGWHEMEADIYDSKGNIQITLYGKWNEAIYGRLKDSYKEILLNSPSQDGEDDGSDLDSSPSGNSPRDNTPDTPPPSDDKISKKEQKVKKKQQKQDKKDRKKQMKIFKKEIKKKLTSEEPLWVHNNKPLPSESLPCKYMTDWTEHTLQIVAMDDAMQAILPPTDSRVRSDRLALEKMDAKKASADKHSLEEKQREDKRIRDKANKKWVPRYFKVVSDADNQEVWEYTGGYWEARDQRINEKTK